MSKWSGGVALSTLLLVQAADQLASAAPRRLAVYYGYPSLVNGARGDLDRAVAVFSEYDVIVLGDGLEFSTPGHGAGPDEHTFTRRLIQRLRVSGRRPLVYGYIDLGRSQALALEEISDRIDRWAAMDAGGVFLDEAGYDFGVTRERQNAAITAAHAHRLSVCLNAFRPDDVFGSAPVPLNDSGGGNPTGIEPIVTSGDALLLESFAIRNDTPESIAALVARTREAIQGRTRFGTRVMAVSTSEDAPAGSTPPSYGWWAAAAFGLDAYGWGMPAFGAVTSGLPWIARPQAEAALARSEYVGELTIRRGRWHRPTTAGTIVLDTASLQGTLAPR